MANLQHFIIEVQTVWESMPKPQTLAQQKLFNFHQLSFFALQYSIYCTNIYISHSTIASMTEWLSVDSTFLNNRIVNNNQLKTKKAHACIADRFATIFKSQSI